MRKEVRLVIAKSGSKFFLLVDGIAVRSYSPRGYSKSQDDALMVVEVLNALQLPFKFKDLYNEETSKGR